MSDKQMVYALMDTPFVTIQHICREFGYDYGTEHDTVKLLTGFLNYITAQGKVEELRTRVINAKHNSP